MYKSGVSNVKCFLKMYAYSKYLILCTLNIYVITSNSATPIIASVSLTKN